MRREIWIETGWSSSVPIRDAAINVLFEVEHFCQKYLGKEEVKIIQYQIDKIIHPQNRYVVQVKRDYQHQYVTNGLKLAEKYAGEIEKARS
ncbi:MAG: hypothetical protein UHS41_00260 [Lachnospiraceae bacterium]|nr:hypothetical protein [Lachnospiraceae bacterium]